ncbi:hypothetical protein ACFV5G_34280 [Streptomyces sp. NPDC059766]|uniref:hypothetical protein n=1 Tax=Streptomyces sp. NPDC059766 TaxID=3346940 RepID=UPI003661E064
MLEIPVTIFIAVKFTVRRNYSKSWLDRVEDLTLSTRRKPGNLFFEWPRSIANRC